MTTTTSSSRNPIKGERLFDRTFARLLAATLRQNGLTMGIYGVCLILVTVCPAFLEAKNYVEGSYLDAPELLVSSWFYGASALIVPVLLAAMLFHYLHNRLSVDFYHAMPLSRKKLFFSRYFVGIVFLLVPLLVSRLLCTVVHLAFYTGRLTAGQIVSSGVIDFLVWAALHVIVFTFSCMVAVTTSNAVESIVYSGAVNGALAAIYFIFVSYSYNLYGISELPDWGLYLSPYGLIGRCMLPNNSWNYSTGNLVMVLVWLLIALAAIPLTLRLYNRFQSEWAQQWGRQSAFSQLMKVLAGFLVSFVHDPLFNAVRQYPAQLYRCGAGGWTDWLSGCRGHHRQGISELAAQREVYPGDGGALPELHTVSGDRRLWHGQPGAGCRPNPAGGGALYQPLGEL